MVKLPSNNSESCIFYTATGIPKEEGLYLAELFSKGLYIQRNIEESLTMEQVLQRYPNCREIFG